MSLVTPMPHTTEPAHRPEYATYVAPRRFDVHTLAHLRHWVQECRAAGHRRLTIDASGVHFVDTATVETLDQLAVDDPWMSIALRSPSTAMTLTLEFLRPASLAAVA